MTLYSNQGMLDTLQGPVERCALCGRPFAADEAFWLARLPSPREVRALCDACAAKTLAFDWHRWTACACQVCGRVYHRAADRRRRRFEVCSQPCRDVATFAERKAARHELMEHTCAFCDMPFTGRRDAKFCGNACRQAAYRAGGL
jgi:hypothetical protein